MWAVSRKMVFAMAIAAAPVERITFLGFYNCRMDVGYPPGTNPLWVAYGETGAYIHHPVLILGDAGLFPPKRLAAIPVIATIGYAALLLLVVTFLFGYHLIGTSVSRVRASR